MDVMLGTSDPSRLGIPGDQKGLLADPGTLTQVSNTDCPQESLGTAAITVAACSISRGSCLAMWIKKGLVTRC